ncbi:MAG: right-handed parallel beta-helix repeat-containing protein, partial [Methanobrevibacter sp.]|nr:right-handed parallel beta-helix repeat-containing protein [Methanobrevibacter sp.]
NSLKDDSSTTHQVTQSTYSQIFNARGYVLTNKVSPGDIIDLSGSFNKKNFIFTIPCSITSSKNDAFLTNCMVKFENVTSDPSSHSFVSNLNFITSIEMSPCVYLLGSSYIDVFNNNAYSTGANSNPTFLVGSSYCNIHDNIYETTFTGYMNMSWKRAGILLGESHYNNIYSNHVTVKDSNPIYLTTYGYEKSNYNVIFNNTVNTSAFSEETGLRNPSAWAYGIHIMGDYNQILNNTIMNTYRGVDSEGSFNLIVGNKIFNLSGSYYEGNNGTDGGEGGIFASYDNIIINNTIYDSKITGPAIYAVVNTTVIGNVVKNITGPNGLQFALTASNCLIENNTFDMNDGNAIYVKGNMTNLTLSNNILSAKNGTGILIQKQTRAKFPVDVTIIDNIFLEDSIDYLNYADVEGKTIINLRNNTVVVVNDTFFKVFGSDGAIASDLFENFIFKGEFSDLMASGASQISTFNLDEKVTIIGDNANIKDISFNINGDNVRIDNILLNITDASANAFSFNNVIGGTLVNSVIYFNSTKGSSQGKDFAVIFANNSDMILNNNTIIVYSDNSALVLNNSNCSLSDNIFNSSSLNHPVVLNDNYSCLMLGENEINSLFDPAILSINGAIVKYLIFIIEDSNYYDYFNPDGSFLDDVIFNFGDTIRIGNVNNKIFRFDIPLIIVGQEGAVLNNCSIILEGESSNSLVSNFTFKAKDFNYDGDISFITIKAGVSNLWISNNTFMVENLTGE